MKRSYAVDMNIKAVVLSFLLMVVFFGSFTGGFFVEICGLPVTSLVLVVGGIVILFVIMWNLFYDAVKGWLGKR